MAVSLAPKHWKRYKDLAWLLVKYGRSDLAASLKVEAGETASEPEEGAAGEGRELAKDLERLGPTFVKLGQLLSTRADLFPPAVLEELARLQDDVEPFSFAQVEEIVSTELNVRISKAFSEFESTPIAAASLGQVHRARLRDGRPVAVKVQRPEIRETVREDLEAFEEIARVLDRHSEAAGRMGLVDTVQEFRRSVLAELDYENEARNLETLAEHLARFPRIVVPRPIRDYTTSRVLTMEYVEGTKITALDPLSRLELPGSDLAAELFRAYLRQILVEGFFHADPHPGNVLVTPDGRLGLIDLGMVARITPGMQEDLLKLLLAVSEGDADVAADRAARIGRRQEGFDPVELKRRVAELVGAYRTATVSQIPMGRALLSVSRAAGESGLRLPPELSMLGKTLLNLDEIARVLDPQFDPNAAVRENAGELLRERFWKSLTPGHVAAGLLEGKEFVEKLPGRVNRLLDLLANNELKVRVDAIDEELLIEGLHKIANRIALGLVLAALIVGASMLMRVETSFRILGYPGFAILLFLAAAAGGVALAVAIVASDAKKPRRRTPD